MNSGLVKILRNHARKYVLAVSLGLAVLMASLPGRACADDFSKGQRGPTELQADYRLSYSENEKGVEALTNNLILKYWDGDEFGKWGFISLPYKFLDSPNGSYNGPGDISAGVGPRYRIDNIHLSPYISTTIPTGEFEKGLGNGRYDAKIGCFVTCFLTDNKKYEFDLALEYNLTGENEKDINPANETSFGSFFGMSVTDKIKAGAGITYLIKENGDALENLRGAIKYTVSPQWNLELVGDIGIDSENIPKGHTAMLIVKHNIEKK